MLGGDLGVRVLGALAAVALVVIVAALGRAVAGERAGRIAGLLAALLTGSIAIDAVLTPGELLAAVPSALSVLCLVLAHRRRDARLVFAAGVLAAAAVLTKQSFLDAGVAGLAFVAVTGALDRELRVRWPLAYAAGAGIPLLALLVWQVAARLPDGGFVYALVGFRLDALHALAGSSIPLHERVTALAEPGARLRIGRRRFRRRWRGLRLLRGDRVLLVTLSAWLAAAVVGVLGGGSYWPHYLIELVPVSCVGAAVLLATRARADPARGPRRRHGPRRSPPRSPARSTSRSTRCGSRSWRSPATSVAMPGPATPSTSCTRGRTSPTTPACRRPTRTSGA